MKHLSVLLFFCALGLEIAQSQNISTSGWVVENRPSQFTSVTLSGTGATFSELGIGAFRHNMSSSTFGSVSLGARASLSRLALESTFGFAGIHNIPRTLGTNFEFKSSVNLRWHTDASTIRLGITHFSNARKIFGFRGPNEGENFLTFDWQWSP